MKGLKEGKQEGKALNEIYETVRDFQIESSLFPEIKTRGEYVMVREDQMREMCIAIYEGLRQIYDGIEPPTTDFGSRPSETTL